MRSITLWSVGTMALASALAAADLLSGTWVEDRNQRKYDDRPAVITYEPQEGGIKFSSLSGPIYAGKFDGKEYPLLEGSPATDKVRLKKIDENTYESSINRGSKKLWAERVEVSDRGKKLTRRVTSWNDVGQATTNVFVHTRQGDPVTGMAHFGKWVMDRSQTKWGSGPEPFTITSDGNGWKYRFTGYKADHSVKFDGSETPVPETAGFTVSGKRIDDRNVEVTFKRDGKVQQIIRFTPTADGKQMSLRIVNHLPSGETRETVGVYIRK